MLHVKLSSAGPTFYHTKLNQSGIMSILNWALMIENEIGNSEFRSKHLWKETTVNSARLIQNPSKSFCRMSARSQEEIHLALAQ